MWGIIPAAGVGSRIQPLAFSKELLPVGSRVDGDTERPRAVSEYLVDRMIAAGADKIVFVISPGKSDIMEYYGESVGGAEISYVVQRRAAGLCDALFRPIALIRGSNEPVLIGLPDTIWFPEEAFCQLDDRLLSFLLFPVARPELFDAVLTDDDGLIHEIQVKTRKPKTHWIWGALKMPGQTYEELYTLWCEREPRDEYLGTLINAYIERGGQAWGVYGGDSYVDVGTLNGYREALALLTQRIAAPAKSGKEQAILR
jgi:dTDP-glucose pyrophosphorylase